MRKGFHSVGERLGYFLVVSDSGYESDVLTPENSDEQARTIKGPRRVVWSYVEDKHAWPPVYHEVARLSLPREAGVWHLCEAWLIAQGVEPGSSSDKIPGI